MLEHERIREAPCGCRTDGPTGLTTAWCPAHAPFPTLYEAEAAFRREYVLRALAHVAGNRTRAAQLLGINRTSLLRLLREKISLAKR